MTYAERIARSVALITAVQEKIIFSQQDVRVQAEMSPSAWKASGCAIFQGMRCDHPGGAPNVNPKYQKFFRRVAHGKYMLTEEGKARIAELT